MMSIGMDRQLVLHILRGRVNSTIQNPGEFPDFHLFESRQQAQRLSDSRFEI